MGYYFFRLNRKHTRILWEDEIRKDGSVMTYKCHAEGGHHCVHSGDLDDISSLYESEEARNKGVKLWLLLMVHSEMSHGYRPYFCGMAPHDFIRRIEKVPVNDRNDEFIKFISEYNNSENTQWMIYLEARETVTPERREHLIDGLAVQSLPSKYESWL
jgi:hypothetical protein